MISITPILLKSMILVIEIIDFDVKINDFEIKIIDFEIEINDFDFQIIDCEIEINDFNLKIIDFNLENNDDTVRARGKGQEKKGTISSLMPSASAPASPAPLSAAAFAIFWNSRPLSVCNRTGGAITEKMSSNAHATERTVLVARGRKKHILVPWSL